MSRRESVVRNTVPDATGQDHKEGEILDSRVGLDWVEMIKRFRSDASSMREFNAEHSWITHPGLAPGPAVGRGIHG
ncbi:hypothetical protein NITHO_1030024 [Nitrolancea hollandica Lb]|uniref:Uncharacterized protein n=1 Tax=Nitrolancea hollandica Lb TaxID=1129897 RepID=I4ECF8_9BACT|nr:hypothetical protein NITHO_1030024 [Nitrolancea hollandica Lb]